MLSSPQVNISLGISWLILQNVSLDTQGQACLTGVGNTTDCAEFNFYADPEAAHIVLNSGISKIVLVPWETCFDATFPLVRNLQYTFPQI